MTRTAGKENLEPDSNGEEVRCRTLLEVIPDGCLWAEVVGGEPCDFLCLGVNSAFEQLVDRVRADLLGRSVREQLPALAAFWSWVCREVVPGGSASTHRIETDMGERRLEVTALCPQPNRMIAVFRDLTLQYRAQEALRAAGAYHRSLFEANPEPQLVVGTTGRINDVNAAAEAFIGDPRQSLLGTDFIDYFMEPERARVIYQRALRNGVVRDFALELGRRDGRTQSVGCDAAAVHDALGRVSGVLIAMRAVSERHCVGSQPHGMPSQQAILDAAAVGLYGIDSRGRCTFINAAGARMLGYAPEELIGQSMHALIHPEWPESQPSAESACPNHGSPGGLPAQGTDERFRRKDGSTLPVEYVRTPVWEDGWALGAVVSFWDISERLRTTNAVERSERLLRTILEYLPVAVFLFDREGRVVESNPAAYRIWGDVRHVGVDRYHEYQGWWADSGERIAPHEWASARAVERGETSVNEVIDILGFDGVRRTVLNSAVPVRDDQGTITSAVAVLQDITALKQAERAVREMNRRLERSLSKLRAAQRQVIQSEKLAALGTLVAGIAHELNNPLMGVMGYVASASRATREPEAKRRLEVAARELERMRELLKNMLGFARPVVEGRLAEVNIQEAVERALVLMQPEFKVRAITVALEADPNLGPVLANADHLQQVFLNLLTNARDAVDGRSERQIRIAIGFDRNQAVVTISDTGSGIPRALRERIFDPFFTTKPPGKGTGLGLSVARSIMADMGGSLTCESRKGAGATFTVTLPLPRRHTEGELQE